MASRCCRLASKILPHRRRGAGRFGHEDGIGRSTSRCVAAIASEVELADCVVRSREYNIEPVGFPRMIVLALDTTGARRQRRRRRRRARSLAEVSGDPALTHGERLPGELIALLARGGRRRSTTSICSPSPPAPARSPGCASASRRCRGWRWRAASDRAGLGARGARRAARTRRAAARRAVDRRAARRSVRRRSTRRTAATALGEPTSLPPAATLDALATQSPPGGAFRFVGDGAVRYRDVDRARRSARAPRSTRSCRRSPRAIGRIAADAPGARRAPARRRAALRPAARRRAGARPRARRQPLTIRIATDIAARRCRR